MAIEGADGRMRCEWPGDGGDALMLAYHDEDWGVQMHDDRELFELLTLEGAQAGLSWATILKRRETYRAAFDGFDIERVANYGEADVARLLDDRGIIRNRAKVRSTIGNAQAILEAAEEWGTFDRLIWSFVDEVTKVNAPRSMDAIASETEESKAMSKALKQRGFGFVGPTICYAFMQSAGLVNDHVIDCFRYNEV